MPGTPAADPAPNDPTIHRDSCPVMCLIRPGQAGACERYANRDGAQARVGTHVTTGEYGSQMLSLGGEHHLTGAVRPLPRVGGLQAHKVKGEDGLR